MSLIRIDLENFKCFKDLSIDLAPITLLTGANSSGKSSVLYGVLGAIQSGEFPLQFSTNGKYVRLGDFKDIILNHDTKLKSRLSFEFQSADQKRRKTKISTEWSEHSDTKLPQLTSLEANSDYYSLSIKKEDKKKYTLTFKYIFENDPMKDFNTGQFFQKLMLNLETTFKEFSKQNHNNDDEKLKNLLKEYSEPREQIKLNVNDLSELVNTIQTQGNFSLDQAFSGIKKIFTEMDSKLNFISSFRLHPERTYYEKSNKDLKVGRFGENYEDQLISWETNNSPEYKRLVEIMKNLGLPNSITAKRIPGGRYEILVKSNRKAKLSSLSDVGFGISQFLPIIIADLQLGKQSNLLIAQPEIHLHPKVQAQFGNYLVEQFKNDQKSYLVETHSEYLINRLRLLITTGELKEEDVNAYFLVNRGTHVEKHIIKFLKNGKIEGAPQEFFDTYMIDVFDIAMNSSK